MRSMFLALAFLSGSVAYADNQLGLGVGVYTGDSLSADTAVLSPVLEGRFKLSGRTRLDLQVPFVAVDGGSLAGQDTTRFRLANPYLGVSYGFDFDVRKLGIGGGLSLPAARLGDGVARIDAAGDYNAASLSRGNYRRWLWAPEALSLVVPLEAEIDLPLVTLRGDAAYALMISTGDGSETESVAQIGAEGLVNLAFLGLGVRAQAVWQPNQDGDNAQVSLGPLAEINAGPFYARSLFVFNIDGPGGRSFSDAAFWGLDLAAGIRF